MNHIVTEKPNRRLLGILSGATVLLLVPVVLQLTIGTGVDGQDFNWKLNDFIIIGVLVFGTGLLVEFLMRKVKNNKKRLLLCGAILLVLLLAWADLAVGIFNIPGFSGS
jgi:hypothetical protein